MKFVYIYALNDRIVMKKSYNHNPLLNLKGLGLL